MCICIGDLGAAQLDKDQIQVGHYKSTNTDAAAGTNAQILTQPAVAGEDVTARSRARNSARGIGTQFTCFTGTKVPILTELSTSGKLGTRRCTDTHFTCFPGANVQILTDFFVCTSGKLGTRRCTNRNTQRSNWTTPCLSLTACVCRSSPRTSRCWRSRSGLTTQLTPRPPSRASCRQCVYVYILILRCWRSRSGLTRQLPAKGP